jgi:PKD repeat protein
VPAHPGQPTSDVTPVGASMLRQAVASINVATPRDSVTCTVTSGTAAACGGSAPPKLGTYSVAARVTPGGSPLSREGTSAAHPSTATSLAPTLPAADPMWYNVTGNISAASSGVVPTTGMGARMAFDPLLGEVVLYTGTSVPSAAPYESLTWVYNGVTWTNLTGSLSTAPSDRWYPGFDYDPAMGGIILVGGWGINDLGLNDTWLFTGTWKNISATTGMLLDASNGGGQNGLPLLEGGIGGSGAAWDPLLHGFLLTDGCDDSSCNDLYALSWLLNSTGWWTISYGPGWGPANPVPDQNMTWLGYTVMAWDPTDQYMVLFGGWDYESAFPQNFTYTYTTGVYTGAAVLGANWDNLTASDAGCNPTCGTPAGRDDGAMTWDAQLGGLFMTGGYNYTFGVYNDTWEFIGGLWNALVPGAPVGFAPVEGPALAVNSTDIGVFLLGGYCASNCSGNEYVFETPPQATLTASTHAVDLGTAVTFTAGWTVGTGTGYTAGWNLSYGNGHSVASRAVNGVNSSTAYTKAFPYTYSAAGTFTGSVTWSDFFYIAATSTGVSVTVNPALAAAITASATTVTAGGSITFTTSPTGGSGTYTYAWNFGDGTTSAVQNPAHTFSKAGSYVVNLTVTDSIGGVVKAASVTITVNAPPSSFSLGTTGTYVIIAVVVVVLAIIAIVLLTRRKKPAPAAQPWQGGSTPPPGAAPPPPPGAGGVPPGAGGSPPPPPPQ